MSDQSSVRSVIDALQARVDDLRERAAGNPADLEGVLSDAFEGFAISIEELRQRDEELLVSREAVEEECRRYRELFEFAPAGCLLTDPRGIIREANRAAAALLEVEESGLVGMPLVAFLLREDREAFFSRLSEMSRLEQPPSWEVGLLPRGGQSFPAALTLHPERDSQAELVGLQWLIFELGGRSGSEDASCGLHEEAGWEVDGRTAQGEDANPKPGRDLQECMRAVERLYHSEYKYQSLVESSPTGIFVYEDGRLTFVNRQLARMLGYSPDELLQVDPREVFHVEDWDSVMGSGRNGVADEEAPRTHETRMVTKTGSTIWVNMENRLVQYRGRASILGNLQDITPKKQMEQALKDSQEELQRFPSLILTAQEEERARIAGALQDSIAQCLTGIKFAVESVVSSAGQPAQESRRELLRSFIPRIQQTVEEVRALSMALRPSVLDQLGLLAAISWQCEEFRSSHPDIEVETHLSEKEKNIPERLKIVAFRILQEALTNVGKHSEADRVVVSLGGTQGVLELTVEDNGQGFDVDSALSFEGGGRALGLRTMRERAELSGGEFSVKSAPGSGTSVCASWPAD